MRIFGQLLLVDKQKVPYLYKPISKEFEFLHKSYATAVAMATMTLQDGGYFGFKGIWQYIFLLFHFKELLKLYVNLFYRFCVTLLFLEIF